FSRGSSAGGFPAPLRTSIFNHTSLGRSKPTAVVLELLPAATPGARRAGAAGRREAEARPWGRAQPGRAGTSGAAGSRGAAEREAEPPPESGNAPAGMAGACYRLLAQDLLHREGAPGLRGLGLGVLDRRGDLRHDLRLLRRAPLRPVVPGFLEHLPEGRDRVDVLTRRAAEADNIVTVDQDRVVHIGSRC